MFYESYVKERQNHRQHVDGNDTVIDPIFDFLAHSMAWLYHKVFQDFYYPTTSTSRLRVYKLHNQLVSVLFLFQCVVAAVHELPSQSSILQFARCRRFRRTRKQDINTFKSNSVSKSALIKYANGRDRDYCVGFFFDTLPLMRRHYVFFFERSISSQYF